MRARDEASLLAADDEDDEDGDDGDDDKAGGDERRRERKRVRRRPFATSCSSWIARGELGLLINKLRTRAIICLAAEEEEGRSGVVKREVFTGEES